MKAVWTYLGSLMGLEDVEDIISMDFSFAEPWAEKSGAAWVLFAAIGAAVLATFFYFKYQPKGRTKIGIFLAVMRAALLVLLVTALANPQATIKYKNKPHPTLWMLFDGTDSMAIQDEYSDEERSKLAAAVGRKSQGGATPDQETRQGYVKQLLTREQDNLLDKLSEKYRIQAYLLQRSGGVETLRVVTKDDKHIDAKALADQLTTNGKTTAIGDALKDLKQRRATNELAGVVVFSDFGQNAGISPTGAETAPAAKLGVPVYTVGIGPTEAVGLTIDLQAPPVMKQGERSSVTVNLRASGLENRQVNLKLTAQRLSDTSVQDVVVVAQKQVSLRQGNAPEVFDYTPKESGRYVFAAEADGVPIAVGRVEREVRVRDDFLRLMYVEHEPTWEWRFIKEVFHRDPLVGQRGFRTFLRSADAKVRQTNELFLPTLTPKRKEFFANDVIFIGDMPSGSLSTRFCEMTKEFVEKFGGGLVILAGPRFGPGVLAETPLADMLPVILAPESKIKDQKDFRLQLTPESDQFEFMRLGSGGETSTAAQENSKAWYNLGLLPWYQPVANKHSLATILAEHPSDFCNDERTHQPLIAIRRYGRGEVVYVAFNESWRMRRKYGELYYRQFWGQMIHRLGLSHAIGDQKRFVPRLDAQRYKEDERVTLTIEAYDANYQALTEDKIPDHKIGVEVVLPKGKPGDPERMSLKATQVREGVFEARFPATVAGEHRVQARDPETGELSEVTFQVSALSAERRSTVRDIGLEKEIAQVSGGRNYTLETVSNLPSELKLNAKNPESTVIRPMWNSWLAFAVLIGLMLVEWLIRKLINLA